MAGKNFGENPVKNFVFVSVGTHPQQFDRLLAEIDRLVEEGKIIGKVFAQVGHSCYAPKNFVAKKFLGLEEFEANLSKADIFITHAGEGSIGLAKNLGKKFICVPRRKEFGEHTNDHQLELAQVVEYKKIGLVAWDPAQLGEKIREISVFKAASIPNGRIAELLDDYFKKDR